MGEFTAIFLLFSSVFALVLSLVSIVFSVQARRQVRFPTKRLSDVELSLIDIEDRVSGVVKLTKKLNARFAARVRTEPKEIEEHPDSWAQLPGEDPEAWKRRVRVKIQSGQKP